MTDINQQVADLKAFAANTSNSMPLRTMAATTACRYEQAVKDLEEYRRKQYGTVVAAARTNANADAVNDTHNMLKGMGLI